MRYAKAARLFRQPQEDRTLTRDTIEQIRFLKQESEGEWTVSKLAESFDVSEGAVIKILKSKFVPSEQRRKKQDLIALVNTGLLPPGADVDQALAVAGGKSDAELDTNYLLGDGKPRGKPSNLLEDGRVIAHRKSPSIKDKQKRKIEYRLSKTSALANRDDNTVPEDGKSVTTNRFRSGVAGQKYKAHRQSDIADNDSANPDRVSAVKKKGSPTPGSSKKVARNHMTSNRGAKKMDGADQFGNFIDESDEDYDDEGMVEMADGGDEHLKLTRKGREFYDENGELVFRI